jgi:hypothetical protein
MLVSIKFSYFTQVRFSHKAIGTEIIGISMQVGPRLGSHGYSPIHCAVNSGKTGKMNR